MENCFDTENLLWHNGEVENGTFSSKKAKFLPLLLTLTVVLGFVMAGYFFIFATRPVPDAFFSKYEETDAIAKNVQHMSIFNFSFLAADAQKNDVGDSYKLVATALLANATSEQQMQVLQKRKAELKKIAGTITDVTLGQQIMKLLSLIDQRDMDINQLLPLQDQVFSALRDHYQAVLSSGQRNQLSSNIDVVIQSLQNSEISILQLQAQIDSAYGDLKAASGIKDSSEIGKDLINAAFYATPTQSLPTIEIPTVPPTVAPTMGPAFVATDSADSKSSLQAKTATSSGN